MTYLVPLIAALLVVAAVWQEVEYYRAARRSARIAARVNAYCAHGARRDN